MTVYTTTAAPTATSTAVQAPTTAQQNMLARRQARQATPAGTNALAPSSTSALNNFANSAGMQFQLQQGTNAIQNMYAAKGALQSGAAMKSLQDYGQQTALQNYFMPYMSLLGQQQAVGAQAGSSIAGVGSSFGNTVANINGNLGAGAANAYNGMGNAVGGAADAASNAALLRGQANANMWQGIGSGLGTLASSFMPTPHF